MENKIKVLIVDDSPAARELLAHILSADPDIIIAGFAADGGAALEAVKKLKPDIVTMDINMPKLDGLSATRQIMATCPVPIVVVSDNMAVDQVSHAFDAIEAGALAVLRRPPGVTSPEHARAAAELTKTVKLMSEIKVVTRIRRNNNRQKSDPAINPWNGQTSKIRVVAIGASTGGPIALQKIVSELPEGFVFPVLVVQHIASGFIEGFISWLGSFCRLPVKIAAHGLPALPGHVYVALEKKHMGIDRNMRLILSDGSPENGVRPSVSFLFRSIAEEINGAAAAILLTGMGRDGAHELKLLREKGAITIAQSEESSVVFGMPGEAVKLEAAANILSPTEIASLLERLNRTMTGGAEWIPEKKA